MEPLLLAHRGVSTDYPENTMSAFMGAVYQGYQIIELDPAFTADGQIVILHDTTINRTARTADGEKLPSPIDISSITYEEALRYDYGIWFSNKFKKEPLPLLADVLTLAAKHNILIKIDNKFMRFPDAMLRKLFSTVAISGAKVAYTCGSLEAVQAVLEGIAPFHCHDSSTNKPEIHYDGNVTPEILKTLCSMADRDRLAVWLPYPTSLNTWFRGNRADESLCKLVKSCARLGLWILSDETQYQDAVGRFHPDIIETTGSLKPRIRCGIMADTHTHSEHSHDSCCPIRDMVQSAADKDIQLITVTDHCDIEYWQSQSLNDMVRDSHTDARICTETLRLTSEGAQPMVLTGMEIGEGFLYPDITQQIIRENPCDQIIGAVHAVRYKGLEMPYSGIDFGTLSEDTVISYLTQYFDDVLQMLETCELDILAHLTCPLRYINGRYHLGVDCQQFESKIRAILQYIIDHAIALEINTSCKGSPYDEWMPEEWIIRLYLQLGGSLITTGSDAHTASRAAHEFHLLYPKLKSLGFRFVYYCKDRYLCQCTL